MCLGFNIYRIVMSGCLKTAGCDRSDLWPALERVKLSCLGRDCARTRDVSTSNLNHEIETSNGYPLVLYQALGSNFLWILPWAIVVTKVKMDQAHAWTFYSIIFGGALVSDFSTLGYTAALGVESYEREGETSGCYPYL